MSRKISIDKFFEQIKLTNGTSNTKEKLLFEKSLALFHFLLSDTGIEEINKELIDDEIFDKIINDIEYLEEIFKKSNFDLKKTKDERREITSKLYKENVVINFNINMNIYDLSYKQSSIYAAESNDLL